MNTGVQLSPHSDLLSAPIPTTPEQQTSLIEEIKRRAKLLISQGDYRTATELYSKALTVAPGDKLIYSNRSFTHLKTGNFTESLTDAERALPLIKGYWRAAAAATKLLKYETALNYLKMCLNSNEDNASIDNCSINYDKSIIILSDKERGVFEKEIVRVQGLMMKEKEKKQKEEAAAAASNNVSKSATVVTQSSSSTTHNNDKTTKTPNTGASINNDPDNHEFTSSDHIRGYKIVNGKKTSFFHHEQTEEEKRLIGDIAPKKLDVVDTATNNNNVNSAGGVSAWNQAGTWEEKNVTQWAVETLTNDLKSTTYDFNAGEHNCTVIVNKVEGLESGHASVATVRGKRRYVYEFTNVKVYWCVHIGDDKSEGHVEILDIDGTCDGEYETKFAVENSVVGHQHLLEVHVKGEPDGFRGEVVKSINKWVELFKSTYSL